MTAGTPSSKFNLVANAILYMLQNLQKSYKTKKNLFDLCKLLKNICIHKGMLYANFGGECGERCKHDTFIVSVSFALQAFFFKHNKYQLCKVF